MSGDEQAPQLTRADIERLGRENPEALAAAYREGRVDDVLAGRDRCQSCGRPIGE